MNRPLRRPASPPDAAEAAADKPASTAPAEPLKGEVSRTDAPGAGVSAAPPAPPPGAAGAEARESRGGATAATSETSSAAGAADAADAGCQRAAPAAAPARPHRASRCRGGEAGRTPRRRRRRRRIRRLPPAPPSGPTEPPPPADTALPAFITTLQARSAGQRDARQLLPRRLDDHRAGGADARGRAAPARRAPTRAFDFCSDVTATDWPPRAEGRFDVIYCLYSTRHRHRVRVKVKVGENQPVPSVTGIWPAANWLEREVYDMFGVNFTGHPDRRRILMPDDWQGFPQRKDYPLEGPGELLMENPIDWLKLRQAREEADIE